MDIRDKNGLKRAASASLEAASFDYKKLVLIYVGLSAAISLVITCVDFYLANQISGTGGLGGLGLRSILATIQTVLPFAQALLTPFWELGFVMVILQLARQQAASAASLLEGFRRFGVSARYLMAQMLIYMAIGMLAGTIGSQIFVMTPFAAPLYEVMMDSAATEEALLAAMTEAETPLLLITLAIFAIIFIPVAYRHRMAGFILMDHPENGALAALRSSRRITRRNCMNLLKLDLSFWWFYAVNGLILLVCYADLWLPYLGISLPFSADAAYFVTFIAATVLQLIWYFFNLAKVEVTYAHAYAALQDPVAPPPVSQPAHQPWNYEV